MFLGAREGRRGYQSRGWYGLGIVSLVGENIRWLGLTDRDEISRDKLRADNRDPLAITESLNIVWSNTHSAELLKSFDTLFTLSATALEKSDKYLPGKRRCTQRPPT